jgi:iron complex outermembrane receptor protein
MVVQSHIDRRGRRLVRVVLKEYRKKMYTSGKLGRWEGIMNHQTLKLALCLNASLAAIIATPSLAQSAAVADDAASPSDIIVTARRVEERLQDVPASITVFNQASLDTKNIRSVTDLATFAPTLTVNQRFGAKGASFSLRGFSQSARTAASVGVYFADVVAPRGGNGSNPAGDGAGPGTLFDLENVQVLNGPQGTLFGRNTTGGAVIVVPKRPTNNIEGYVEGSYGKRNYRRIQGVINLPFTDAIRLRLGMDLLGDDGYLRNRSGIGPDRLGDQNYASFRASLVLDVADNIENYTIATYARAWDHGTMAKITQCNPASYPLGVLACQQLARQNTRGFYDVENSIPDPKSALTQWQVINTTTWTINDNLSLKNILSYSQVRLRSVTDILGANYVVPSQIQLPNGTLANTGALAGIALGFAQNTRAPGFNNADQENFVEELRLQGTAADGKLNFQGGLYYEHSTPRKPTGTQAPNLIYCANSDNFQCVDVAGQLSGLRTGTNFSFGFLGNQRGKTYFLNRAIYGQATYALMDNLKLTGGLRYTWDKSRSIGELTTFRFISPAGAVLTTPIRACQFGALVNPATCRTDGTEKSKAPTWLVGLDYNPGDNILLYAKYARGYRQGSVQYNVVPSLQVVGPEKVDSYEIGTKTSFSGAISGTFNVAAFYNKLRDQQISIQLACSTNCATSTTSNLNAGKSTIWGVEADASLRPFAGLTLEGNIAYLNTKINEIDITLPTGSPYDVFVTPKKGDRLPFVPKLKWNLTATYQLPLAEEAGRLTASATYTHSSSFIYVATASGTIGAVGLLSGNLTWNHLLGSPVDVSLFGTNLTAKKYYTAVNDFLGSGGYVAKYIGEPRTFGVRVRYNFGE